MSQMLVERAWTNGTEHNDGRRLLGPTDARTNERTPSVQSRALFLLVVQFSILFQINPDVKAVYGLCCVGMAGFPPLAPPTSPLMRKCPPGGAMGRAGRRRRVQRRPRRAGEYVPGELGRGQAGTASRDRGTCPGSACPAAHSVPSADSGYRLADKQKRRKLRSMNRRPGQWRLMLSFRPSVLSLCLIAVCV